MKCMALFVALVSVGSVFALEDGTTSDGKPNRVLWTTSKISGSPEPPPPFQIERAFKNLAFQKPVLLVPAPQSPRLFVAEQRGRILSFENRADSARADEFADLKLDFSKLVEHPQAARFGSAYGLVFHPNFPQTPWCFVAYTLISKTGQHLMDGTRLSRFNVTFDADVPKLDVDSETVVLTWREGGHNGGCLKFGHDGFLYVSAGDAESPSPPDRLKAGQDVSNLLSTIMRIDVDRADGELPYAIPPDNPFVNRPQTRPEIWSYGYRNPWRMSIDRATGDLWVGDVGWELYEMVYLVQRGSNYGWSIMEGPQPVNINDPRGPTPILPPTIAYSHSLGASVTGGYVYRGKKLPELVGSYIYGDFETRRIWAAKYDAATDRVTSNKEIAPPVVRVVSFGEDNAGELYLVDYDRGTLHELVPAKTVESQSGKFPTTLSDSGLFGDVARHEFAAGVIPFDVNVPQWMDGATAERFVAVPGNGAVNVLPRATRDPGSAVNWWMKFPQDSVLGKTISITDKKTGQPRRVETQILHFSDNRWHGYTYAWNEQQTDATLVPADGAEREVESTASPFAYSHRFHSRAECLRCHNPWVGYQLGFTLRQINRDGQFAGRQGNQIRMLADMGLLTGALPKPLNDPAETTEKYAVPLVAAGDDLSASELSHAARSWLDVNCAHCHQNGAGGTATIDLRSGIALPQMKAIGLKPMQGDFSVANAQIVAAGDPYRSILYHRISRTGRGRMPHIGSELVDPAGTVLIRDWIRQLPAEQGENKAIAAIMNSQNKRRAIESYLLTPASALQLAEVVDDKALPKWIRKQITNIATENAAPEIRGLFERYLPPNQRVRTLGTSFSADEVLALSGKAERGRDLFFKDQTLQCRNCHTLGDSQTDNGKIAGPKLDDIGKRYKREEILQHIVEPSKLIDRKFAQWTIETASGQVFTGILEERTAKRVRLRDTKNKVREFTPDEVEEIIPRKESLMPEQLLRDVTAQQAADLLEFLSRQRVSQ